MPRLKVILLRVLVAHVNEGPVAHGWSLLLGKDFR